MVMCIYAENDIFENMVFVELNFTLLSYDIINHKFWETTIAIIR
jgi:hypothetical protein